MFGFILIIGGSTTDRMMKTLRAMIIYAELWCNRREIKPLLKQIYKYKEKEKRCKSLNEFFNSNQIIDISFSSVNKFTMEMSHILQHICSIWYLSVWKLFWNLLLICYLNKTFQFSSFILFFRCSSKNFMSFILILMIVKIILSWWLAYI